MAIANASTPRKWSDDLLAGIESIPRQGIPGRIVVFGIGAEPILAYPSEEDVLIAAAEYGQGRVITMSHDSYAGHRLVDVALSVPEHPLLKLHANIRHWVTKSSDHAGTDTGTVTAIDLSDDRNGNTELAGANLIYWCGGEAGRITSEAVLGRILDGAGFVHAMTPWGWLQLHPGKSLKHMPFWDVLIAVGLCYTDDYIGDCVGQYLVSNNVADKAHLGRFLSENAYNSSKLIAKSGLSRTLRSLPDSVVDSEMKATIGDIWQVRENVFRERERERKRE